MEKILKYTAIVLFISILAVAIILSFDFGFFGFVAGVFIAYVISIPMYAFGELFYELRLLNDNIYAICDIEEQRQKENSKRRVKSK